MNPSRPKSFVCETCGSDFTRPADLKTHHLTVHVSMVECTRKGHNGFMRKDDQVDHVRQSHRDLLGVGFLRT